MEKQFRPVNDTALDLGRLVLPNVSREIEDIYQRGMDALIEGSPVYIGASLFNSFFSHERIDQLMGVLLPSKAPLILMSTDGPSAHNFKAINYENNRIESKVRLNANALFNKFNSVMSKYDLADLPAPISYVNWKGVYTHTTFIQKKEELSNLFNSCPEFKNLLESRSASVLEGLQKLLLRDSNVAKLDLAEGAQYVIDELALLLAAPDIHQVERIAYVYHQQWDIAERFLSGEFDGISRKNIGLILWK